MQAAATYGSAGMSPPRVAGWRGRSGRTYRLSPESLGDFVLARGALYLVAKGGHALWVGSAEDVIGDHASRARFRLALGCADRAFRLADEAGDDVARLTTIWDLEGAEPEPGTLAA